MSDRLQEVKDRIVSSNTIVAEIAALPNLEITGFNGHFQQGKQVPRNNYLQHIMMTDIRPFFGRRQIEALRESMAAGVPCETHYYGPSLAS